MSNITTHAPWNATLSVVRAVIHSVTSDQSGPLNVVGHVPAIAWTACVWIWIAQKLLCIVWPYLVSEITYLDDRSIEKAVKALRSSRFFVEFGSERLSQNDHTIPKLGISLGRLAAVVGKIEHTIDGGVYTVLSVCRPIWLGPVVAPHVLVPEDDPEEPGNIHVLERISNDRSNPALCTFTEQAVAAGVPQAAFVRADAAARQIVDRFERNKRLGCVFVLLGPPGLGKSLTARIVADRLHGLLFDDYDASSVGYCLSRLVMEWADKEEPLVAVYEEFDVSLQRILSDEVECSEKSTCDASSKASWNKTLDRFCRKRNCLMLMTTNKTLHELEHYVCGDDPSLLRDGRVAEFIHFESADTSASSETDESA